MRSSPRTGIDSWITASFARFSVAAAEVVDAAALMVGDLGGTQRITLGADKGYDRREFVQVLRDKNVTPHVARGRKGSAIDGRTTRHGGYAMSIRRRIESIFGRMKTIGGMEKTRFRGLERVGLLFSIAATAYTFCASPDWLCGQPCQKTMKTRTECSSRSVFLAYQACRNSVAWRFSAANTATISS